jgi:hypothetical protein
MKLEVAREFVDVSWCQVLEVRLETSVSDSAFTVGTAIFWFSSTENNS